MTTVAIAISQRAAIELEAAVVGEDVEVEGDAETVEDVVNLTVEVEVAGVRRLANMVVERIIGEMIMTSPNLLQKPVNKKKAILRPEKKCLVLKKVMLKNLFRKKKKKKCSFLWTNILKRKNLNELENYSKRKRHVKLWKISPMRFS